MTGPVHEYLFVTCKNVTNFKFALAFNSTNFESLGDAPKLWLQFPGEEVDGDKCFLTVNQTWDNDDDIPANWK